MTNKPIHHWDITETIQNLQGKKISAQELTKHYLERIKKYGLNNSEKSLGAFLQINEEASIAKARELDEKGISTSNGASIGAIAGLPIAHKDLFVTKDFDTTAASKMLQGYKSPFNATVVEKLSQAGAINLGKLNCDEFAMGSGNENSAYYNAKNPWDTSRVAGGSSGGSAAAVAARLIPAATGTDTGGSIRQPAAFCGITGIKPTYGRISRYGMIAFASSLDQAGPMAASALDCAALLSLMSGADIENDSTSLDIPQEDYLKNIENKIEGIKIGLPKEFFSQGLSDEIKTSIENAIKEYEKLGAKIVEINLPLSQLSIPVYYIIASAEASSNLSRFDGVKFGYRASEYTDLEDMYKKTRTEGFGEEVKRRIITGTYVLSHGYYDAYYLQAQKVRRLISQDFKNAFENCDIIAAPIAPSTAWKIGEHKSDPLADYLADIYTLPASLAGLPAMSIPVGFDKNKMPIGMQLIGNYLKESTLLTAAHNYQKQTNWHKELPEEYK